jgi:hypothetical protein
MSVPEASAYEYNCSVPPEDQIGVTGQLAVMKTVPEPTRVHCTPEHHFRVRILSSDPRHHSGACRGIDNVDHSFSPG